MIAPLSLPKQPFLRQIFKRKRQKNMLSGLGALKYPICTAKNNPLIDILKCTKPILSTLSKENRCIKSELRFTLTNNNKNH